MRYTPNHTSLVTKGSYTFRDIHETIGYIKAEIDMIKDMVDECIAILDELAQGYEKQGGEKHEP